ncbi:hypothetical protein Pmani_027078 [Petrolisthes manimaculis]|uniref:Uncharacterized protein n=1 Tax=Petrolisthes manimaculis TaxID=1843537 RepID=A0AAE1TX85_9EUCA|nr:hypothetical protein Pmani_027078 [Petrolisthes manimaculis]
MSVESQRAYVVVPLTNSTFSTPRSKWIYGQTFTAAMISWGVLLTVLLTAELSCAQQQFRYGDIGGSPSPDFDVRTSGSGFSVPSRPIIGVVSADQTDGFGSVITVSPDSPVSGGDGSFVFSDGGNRVGGFVPADFDPQDGSGTFGSDFSVQQGFHFDNFGDPFVPVGGQIVGNVGGGSSVFVPTGQGVGSGFGTTGQVVGSTGNVFGTTGQGVGGVFVTGGQGVGSTGSGVFTSGQQGVGNTDSGVFVVGQGVGNTGSGVFTSGQQGVGNTGSGLFVGGQGVGNTGSVFTGQGVGSTGSGLFVGGQGVGNTGSVFTGQGVGSTGSGFFVGQGVGNTGSGVFGTTGQGVGTTGGNVVSGGDFVTAGGFGGQFVTSGVSTPTLVSPVGSGVGVVGVVTPVEGVTRVRGVGEPVSVTVTSTVDQFVTLTDTAFNSIPVTVTNMQVTTNTAATRRVLVTAVDNLVAVQTSVVLRPARVTITEVKTDFSLVKALSVTHVTLTHSAYVIHHRVFTTTATETVVATSTLVVTSIHTSRTTFTAQRTITDTVLVAPGYTH